MDSTAPIKPPSPAEVFPSGDWRSLPEAHRTVMVMDKTGPWHARLWRFIGPAFLVCVGYMDPGNWGTDLAGGSQFGYTLLWVILASNLMAIFLQILCARLGVAAGLDLAQACRTRYSKPTSIALWLLCEVAIIACDLAEVIGSAVALKLLMHLPLHWGVVITGLDVLILLALINFGFRKLEAIVAVLVLTIGVCFAYNIYLAQPDLAAAAAAAVTPRIPSNEALLISLGILGATVMPHNLYLHSSVVQTRQHALDDAGKREAIKFNTIDTVIALGSAFFVNAAILILAAAVFHAKGIKVEELEQAHELLSPMLGGAAATAFAVALLCSGQSSTITGTLAGQVVMEGFVNIRIKPWVRRLITRGLAIIPALLIVISTGGKETVNLLVLSQVVLSMQLPFAVFPLIAATADKKRMGAFTNPIWVTVLGYTIAAIISGLNVYVLWDKIGPLWTCVIAAVMLAFAAWVNIVYRRPSPARVP